MNANPYSADKFAQYPEHISALRTVGLTPHPIHLHFVISDLCNQDCHFCAYRMSSGWSSEQFADAEGNRNPKRMMPVEKALEILTDAAAVGVRGIQFTGGGEPTVHPHHLELFETAQRLGMRTALVTNGVLLRQGWEPVYRAMDWIRVSIDASTAENYAAVRRTRPESYERVLTSVHRIADAIDPAKTLLGVGYVLTRENWQGLERGLDRIAGTGARYVRLTAMFSRDYDRYYDGIEDEITEAVRRVKLNYPPGGPFSVVDLWSQRIQDMQQHAPDYDFCGYQQFTTYVGGNLKLYRCCTTSYSLHGEIGDLTNMRFSDWIGQRGEKFSGFDPKTCGICQFNDKNRAILALRDFQGLHLEFP